MEIVISRRFKAHFYLLPCVFGNAQRRQVIKGEKAAFRSFAVGDEFAAVKPAKDEYLSYFPSIFGLVVLVSVLNGDHSERGNVHSRLFPCFLNGIFAHGKPRVAPAARQ